MVGFLVAHLLNGNVVKTAELRAGAGEQDGRMRGNDNAPGAVIFPAAV